MLRTQHDQGPLLQVDEVATECVEHNGSEDVFQGNRGMIRKILRPVQTLLFIVESDKDDRDWKFRRAKTSRQFEQDSRTGGIVARGWKAWALSVIVRTHDDGHGRGTESRDDISTIAAELLHLDFEASAAELFRDVLCRIYCARTAGPATLPLGIRQPRHVCMNAVDRARGS